MPEDRIICKVDINHPECGLLKLVVSDDGMAVLIGQGRSVKLELPNVIFDLCQAYCRRSVETAETVSLSSDEHAIIRAFVISRWDPVIS
jgi:hypothetical protein